MRIESLDHLVLTVRDLDATLAFYERLGMTHEVSPDGRHALRFGSQKLNLHLAGREFEPHAASPVPGSADLCFLIDELDTSGLEVIEGPVPRRGAIGPLTSIYIRDPDGNLVELSTPR
jgi:catechol 2,3-dioxygenase-like lactoylglutathione lyase family enzyme